MTTDGAKRQLISQLKEGGVSLDILGFITWHNIRDVDITQDQFISMLKSCGLSEKFAPSHNYRSAFIRALHNLEEQRIIRLITEDENSTVYQFTAEDKVTGPDGTHLNYNFETRIVVDKDIYRDTNDFGKALVEGDPEIKRVLVELFNREKTRYHSSDISRYIHRIFESQADIISLREQGNIYFVSSAFRSVIDAVAKLVDMLGGGCSFDYIPMPNVASSRKTVKRAFTAEIETIFNDLVEEIETANRPTAESKNYDAWVQNKVIKINKIKDRIALYSDVLNGAGERLIKDVTDLETSILKPRLLEV